MMRHFLLTGGPSSKVCILQQVHINILINNRGGVSSWVR
jgi:hypothetical protein